MDGGGGHQVGVQQVHGIAHPRHVGHRVQRPHLVVVDVSHRAAVGLSLGLSDGVIDLPGPLFYLLGHGQAVDYLPDVSRRGVVVMVVAVMLMAVVPVVVLVLLMAVDGHLHPGARNAARLRGHRSNLHSGQAEAVHGLQKVPPLFLAEQLVQGGHEHIPRRSHAAL